MLLEFCCILIFDIVLKLEGKLYQQLALFELNVCRDQHFAVKCPNHTKIHIQAAKYHYQSRKCGKIADLDDDQFNFDNPNSGCSFDSSQVSKICHNREECKVDVESLLTLEYQELCPIKNILSVFYFCKPSQFMTDSYCDNSKVEMKCRRLGQKISIFDANYGRKSDPWSKCNERLDSDKDCIVNTKDELITDCHGKYTCSFNVSEEKFGSLQHCEGMGPRTLNLIHICVDEKVFPNYLAPTTVASSTQQKTFHKVWSEKSPELEVEDSSTVGGNFQQTPVNDDIAPQTTSTDGVPTTMVSVHRPKILTYASNSRNFSCDILRENRIYCLNKNTPNFVSIFYCMNRTFAFIKDQKSKFFGFSALSSAAGVVFCAVAVTLYKLTATPPASAGVNSGHSHSDSRHHRTGDSRPDLIPLPRLPPKIIDPLTLNVDDFSTYEPARYATLRKSCSVPVRPCRASTVR